MKEVWAPFLLFGAILKDFLAYKARWELYNSSSPNKIEKFLEKLLSSVVSSLAEEKKWHCQFLGKISYACHKLPTRKCHVHNLRELQLC